jgi:hypothetical protein
MPIPYQVTMYKCSHRCGKYSRNEKFIAGHEPHCWKNPARRTCKTCIYENYFSDSAGYITDAIVEPPWWERHCDHPDFDEDHPIQNAINEIYDALGKEHPGNLNLYCIQIPPVVDCQYWTKKETEQ